MHTDAQKQSSPCQLCNQLPPMHRARLTKVDTNVLVYYVRDCMANVNCCPACKTSLKSISDFEERDAIVSGFLNLAEKACVEERVNSTMLLIRY